MTDSAASTEEMKGEALLKACSSCVRDLAVDEYSGAQLKKKGKRVCKSCVAKAQQPHSSGVDAGPKVITFEIVYPPSSVASDEFDGDSETDSQLNRVSPFVPLADSDEALQFMQHTDEIVIHAPTVQLVVDYPLSHAFVFQLTAPHAVGFTRRQLVKQIAALYARIYREEEESATRPMTDLSAIGWLNRGRSFGRYGIRMHDLDDLLLHSVIRRADGKFELGIDS